MPLFGSEVLTKAPPSLIPKCGACGLDKNCKSPKMPVTGEGRKGILVIGEAPGADEDEQSTHFAGQSGRLLRDELRQYDIDLDRDCWKTNAIICRPHEGATPTSEQIEYCRPNLNQTIKQLNPRQIIPLGGVAVKSLIGPLWKEDPGPIGTWVGWRIPLQAYNAWVTPNFHPMHLVNATEVRNGAAVVALFRRYLRRMFELSGRPWATVPRYADEIKIVLNPDEAAAWIRRKLAEGGVSSFDYETDRLKPDHPESRIVTCSICWMGRETIAYPWAGEAIKATGEYVRSPLPKIGANCFSGDTRLLTKEHGVVCFKDVAGSRVTVLNRDRVWVSAIICDFGEQETVETRFCRRNYIKTVRCTAGHRWILVDGSVKRTDQLISKRSYNGAKADQVSFLCADRLIQDHQDYMAGVRHGVVFGDGSYRKTTRNGMLFSVRLCGHKSELLRFFDGFSVKYYNSAGGDPCVWLSGQRVNLKLTPPECSSDSYLIGFFRGIMATDGSVSRSGQISITGSSSLMDWCHRALPRVGYWFQSSCDLSKYAGRYEGAYNTKAVCHTFFLSRESVVECDLLLESHSRRFRDVSLGPFKFNGFGECRKEAVYCAVVPDGESFVLDDGLLTMNCKFEDRWTRRHFGFPVENFVWDTVNDAHVLDNRDNITSVKFQAFVRLGIPDWSSAIKPYLTADGDNERNRIHLVDLRSLLVYNGIDSLVEYKIALLQKEELKYALALGDASF